MHGPFTPVEYAGSVTLLRADLNIQINESGDVGDVHRLTESVPTISALREAGARVVIASHLGRPNGQFDARWSLAPVAPILEHLLGTPVAFHRGCTGRDAEAAAAALSPGGVLLLENLRFSPGEEQNDPAFARALARLGTRFVNDAFGTMHRAHASIVGVPRHLPAAPGLLVEREVARLSEVLHNPEAPFGLVLGGAKVHDKLPLLEHLLPRTAVVCIGGAMANAILRFRHGVTSIAAGSDDVVLGAACDLLEAAERRGTRVLLPVDVVAGRELVEQRAVTTVAADQVPAGWQALDIGPRTVARFARALIETRTVVWNGPMGRFEDPSFAAGSIALAEAMADLDARVLAGGGDTAAAVRLAGVAGRYWHLSTGGGATLALLGGEPLPGLEALEAYEPVVQPVGAGRPPVPR